MLHTNSSESRAVSTHVVAPSKLGMAEFACSKKLSNFVIQQEALGEEGKLLMEHADDKNGGLGQALAVEHRGICTFER